ncbi:MAG TPA: hypothetical protein VGI10_19465, partial [Polyangiaceae bacterium]
MNSKRKLGLGILVALSLGAAVAVAAPAAERQCDGKQAAGEHGKRGEERFKQADKNGDGFLTQAEVGD